MKKMLMTIAVLVSVLVAGFLFGNVFHSSTPTANAQDSVPAWEKVKVKKGINLKKLKVPGGWIVKVQDLAGTGISITFMPDPNHQWR